jgi:hypothetical protein
MRRQSLALAIAYSACLPAETAARAIDDFNRLIAYAESIDDFKNLAAYSERFKAKRRNKSDRKRNRQNRWR